MIDNDAIILYNTQKCGLYSFYIITCSAREMMKAQITTRYNHKNFIIFATLAYHALLIIFVVISTDTSAFATTYINGREVGSVEREKIIKELNELQDDVEDLKSFPWVQTIICAVIAGFLSALLVILVRQLSQKKVETRQEEAMAQKFKIPDKSSSGDVSGQDEDKVG